MIVTSRLERRTASAFSCSDLDARGGLRLSAFTINASMSPCCSSSASAVFGPTPRAPGMLSELSPTNAR